MTLDLNMPSFHRSASQPSVVCATCVEEEQKKEEEREEKHEGGGIKLMYVCHEHVAFASSPCIPALINACQHQRSISLVLRAGKGVLASKKGG